MRNPKPIRPQNKGRAENMGVISSAKNRLNVLEDFDRPSNFGFRCLRICGKRRSTQFQDSAGFEVLQRNAFGETQYRYF